MDGEPVTQRDKINSIYQILLGIPGTEEGGMAQDIQEIKVRLAELNGQVRTNTLFRKVGTWFSGSLFLVLIGLLALSSVLGHLLVRPGEQGWECRHLQGRCVMLLVGLAGRLGWL